VVNGTIAIAHKALQTAMDKVKALTPRGTCIFWLNLNSHSDPI
jgi:hypothetical protein